MGMAHMGASYCAACVLGHELAHTIFCEVNTPLFCKKLGVTEKVTFSYGESGDVEAACDCFGNFLAVLAERMAMNTPER
jgi:hypothetical protein